MQAPHSSWGAVDRLIAGRNMAEKRPYAAMLLHSLLVNSNSLHPVTHLSDYKTCYENGEECRALCHVRGAVVARVPEAERSLRPNRDVVLDHGTNDGQST